jgi:peptidyl-prolyl cis-trans isomerase C
MFYLSAVPSVRAEQADKNKEVLAKIGKEVITRDSVDLRISGMPPEMQKNYVTAQQKQDYLDQLVRLKLLALEAKASGLDRDKAFTLRLQDTVNRVLAAEYLQKKVHQGINITDKDIEAWYKDHKEDFKKPDMVRAQHILVRIPSETKKEEDINAYLMKAQHIKNELDGGADFKTLAEKYSDDTGSKARGGELGFITRNRVVPEFAEAAFALKKNEISNPVKTAYGYHIIRVTDRIEESYKTLKEAEGDIRNLLQDNQRRALTEKEVDRLKKKYNVVYEN